MQDALTIEEFLAQARDQPAVDVRTPAEFAAGHLPGARNLPLFSNDERAEIGTAYKHQGRAEAVKIGLARLAPRLTSLADRLLETAADARGPLLLYCWRGGMRSGSVAWLAGTLGLRAVTLHGGYKAFRRTVLGSFDLPRPIRVLGGLTGTGKTSILSQLAARGAQMIDLEMLAHHKGSAFGDLGEHPQPSQEQFENELGWAWLHLETNRTVWLEDESRMIGRRVIPAGIWRQKLAARVAVVEIPEADRIRNLREVYENHPVDQLESRIEAIRTRLGGDRANKAIAALRAGDAAAACGLLLTYYDRTYRAGLAERAPGQVEVHAFDCFDPAAIAATLAGHS